MTVHHNSEGQKLSNFWGAPPRLIIRIPSSGIEHYNLIVLFMKEVVYIIGEKVVFCLSENSCWEFMEVN